MQSWISIHALREEGDMGPAADYTVAGVFQSTPSARRATASIFIVMITSLFQSTPSARRATDKIILDTLTIAKFQSTPSARRATDGQSQRPGAVEISIHALREEGDGVSHVRGADQINFNPRPPRGGRLLESENSTTDVIFQSTPSARRATFFC